MQYFMGFKCWYCCVLAVTFKQVTTLLKANTLKTKHSW